MSAYPSNTTPANTRYTPPDSIVKEEDEELAALGGKTRLVPRKSPSLPASPQATRHPSHTPSPQSSPVQGYHAEHASPVHEHNGSMLNWNAQHHPLEQSPYPSYYSTSPGQWSQDHHYAPLQSPSMMLPQQTVQFAPYEQMSPVVGSYISTHSPIDSQINGDPQASWHSFYAQYQSGMPP
jgi:hypothetical protein